MTAIGRAFRRIQHALGFGTTTTVPDDSGTVQTVQIQVNQLTLRDSVPVVHLFGFSSVAPIGTDVVTISAQGDPTMVAVIGQNNQALRPKNIASGGTQIYDAFQRFLFFVPNGPIEINAANTPVVINGATTVTINAPDVIINGDVQVNGKVNTTGDVVAGSISLQNHVSTEVQPGGGKSGPPQ
jgi:phage gp45-like